MKISALNSIKLANGGRSSHAIQPERISWGSIANSGKERQKLIPGRSREEIPLQQVPFLAGADRIVVVGP
jgi:hypothetical protein